MIFCAIETLRFDRRGLAYLPHAELSGRLSRSAEKLSLLRRHLCAARRDAVLRRRGRCLRSSRRLTRRSSSRRWSSTRSAFRADRVKGGADCRSRGQGRRVIDFGGRRAHGIDAAVTGARAAYIGGADATANVYAGRDYGVPVPAPWRTASCTRSTTRWTPSAPSRASIPSPCFWSTPTTRSRA